METKRKSFLARATMTLSGARCAAVMLLVMMLTMTAQTAWADTWPAYITDIILVGGSSDEVTTAKSANSGYSWCSMDLNDGAGGDDINLGYKTGYRANVNGGYITDIIVIDAEGTNPPSTVTYSGRTYYLCPYDGGSHFEDVKGNLNSNCGGGWNLYLYYTKANIGKQAVSSITVNSTKDGAINCYYTNGNSHETQIDLNRGLSGSSDVYMHLTTATKTNRPSVDPVMASGLTYNGGEQQLIATAATLASGTMYYRIGTSGEWKTSISELTATNAGGYTVQYYAGSNSYSDASSTHSTTVSIGKSVNSGVTVSCADIVEGNALNPQLGGTNLSTGAVTYKYCTTQNGTYTATAPTTAGTYYVKATVAADGNCNEFTTAYASFKIVGDWALHNSGDSEADAYVISTTDELDLLAQRVNAGNAYSGKYFRLGANITYSHDSEWNNTTSTENNYTPIGKKGATFKGHFDGKGFTVSGIRISSSSDYNGLFGYLYDGATVKNVILSDARIMSGSYSGGIAGDCNISTITNCWVKSNVCIGRYSYVGGIAGNLYGGAIIGCRSEATLIAASGSGRQRYGGIAGSLNVSAANVKHCIVAGATVPGTAYRGAVVGRLWLGSLTNNYYINCSVAGVADATNVGCTDDTNLADTNGARHAVTIGAATGVTITPVGTETNYNLSGITAYEGNNGIIYGGQLYAGAGETVRLNIAYTVPDGCTLNGFTDGNGNALADNGDGSYTLTMTGAAATVTPDVYDADLVVVTNQGTTNATTITDNNGMTRNVVLQGRTLYKDGKWNTLCLPFDVTIASSPLSGDNVQAMTLNNSTSALSGTTLTLNFVEATNTTIPAGTPFIIKWDGDGSNNLVNPVFMGVTISNASADVSFTGGKFKGTYAYQAFDSEDKSILLVGGSNLYWPQNGASLGACRAYFELSDGASASEFVLNFGDETTGIRPNRPSPDPSLNNGGEWYDLSGRKLTQKPTQKGVYIVNGKKVVVK